MFGVKRPAQQPSEDRSEAGEPVGSSPNGSKAAGNGSKPTGNGSKPAANGSKPAANGSKPAGNGSKSAANGSKPDGPAAAVADAGTPPATSNAQAAASNAQAAASNAQAAASDGQPPESGSKPPGAEAGHRQPGIRLLALCTVAAAAITAGVVVAVTQSSPPRSGQARSAAGAASGPIHLTAITPASAATGVNGADPIVVTFSGEMSPKSAKPKLTPSVPGEWTTAGDSLIFMPSTAFQPSTKVTVSVPAGTSGVRSAGGGLLSSPVTSQFTTGAYSQAGLAVLLAQQGYLPMSWGPERVGRALAMNQGGDPAAQTPQGIAYAPPPGAFTWAAGYPATLHQQWSPDHANVLLAGAVMAFESEHNMPLTGNLTPQLWKALFVAQQRGERNANGYTYAIASKGSPEKLTIWHNGQMVQSSLANTGIAVSPTVDGTFPVFERFRFQIMRGTNPDGSKYADPVQYVAYFNSGDAVHYFPRGGYGWPQSLGCVELNLSDAQRAWPYLTYGSLVSVVS